MLVVVSLYEGLDMYHIIKTMEFEQHIACIGTGHVGGHTMAVTTAKYPSIRVTIIDVNKSRIDAWNTQKLPIIEPGLEDVVRVARGRNLFFTTEMVPVVDEADIIFLCVNTPTKTFGSLLLQTVPELMVVFILTKCVSSVS